MNGLITKHGLTAATAKREKAFNSAVQSSAVDRDISSRNPPVGIKSCREAQKREIRLSMGQAKVYSCLLSPTMEDIVEIGICTGFKKEKIRNL